MVGTDNGARDSRKKERCKKVIMVVQCSQEQSWLFLFEVRNMNIIDMDINKIKPYEKNAKKHDDTQISNVAESIKQFGWKQPMVIDKDGVIVIGHCRYAAAKKMGLKVVPVVMADELNDEQVRKLRLLDNKTNESPWDFDLLAEDLEGMDFDGFEMDWGIMEEPSIEDCNDGEVRDNTNKEVQIVVTFDNCAKMRRLEQNIRDLIDESGAKAKVIMLDENNEGDEKSV